MASPICYAEPTVESARYPDQIIVTAQSPNQQVQNVPVTVQTMSGETLRDIGVTNLGELDVFVPGLSIDVAQPVRPAIYLRGVGTEDFGIGTESPVGIYTDGVFVDKNGGALLNFNDISRIEVFKGPEGALFGHNTTGGAISIITNDPTRETEVSGLIRLGNRGSHHEEALYNTPLSDSVAFRFSVVDQYAHGWAHNTFDGKRMGDDNDWGARAALRWHNDSTSAVLKWEHEEMNESGPPIYSLTGGNINFGGPAQWVNPLNQPLANDATPNLQSRNFNGVTLRVEHALPFATLTSTTAYRHYHSQNWQDNDGTANPAAYLANGYVETNTNWQQEFKLSGKTNSLDWVAGVSAMREQATELEDINLTTTSLDTIVNSVAGLAPYATLTSLAQGLGDATGNATLQGINLLGLPWQEGINDKSDSKSYALYGNAIWHLASDTNLTLRGRFTHDVKSFSWYNPLRTATALDAKLGTLNQAQFFPTLVDFKLLTAPQSALLQNLVSNNMEFNNPDSTNSPYAVSGSWNNFSPGVVFDKHLSPDNMVYVSWNKGYQAGGFNAVDVNGRFDEERVTNLEVGIKGQLRSVGLSYGISAFHYAYTNLQSLALVPGSTSTGVPSYQIINSNQHATGIDLEADLRINTIWRLTGSAEYIDQVYAQYTAPTGVSLDGQAVGAPYLSATAGVAAKWPLLGGTSDFNLMLGYIGPKRCNTATSMLGTCLHANNVDAGPARTRIDTRLSWDAPSKKWGVGLVVDNLTNRQYIAEVGALGAVVGSPYAYLTRPRTASVELRVKM